MKFDNNSHGTLDEELSSDGLNSDGVTLTYDDNGSPHASDGVERSEFLATLAYQEAPCC